MTDNYNFVNLILANSDTFKIENYDDLISTLKSSVQHIQSIVQIEAQQFSRMKNQMNVWKKNARKYNIMKVELEKAKKKWTKEKKKKNRARKNK